LIIAFFFTESGKNGGKVPGAVDNLSAVGITLAVGRILKEHPGLHPVDTEIRLISFGGEEAGVRGARSYVKAHEAELKSKNTICINYETIINPEIAIITSDKNGFQKNSPEVINALKNAAIAAKVPYKVNPFPFGGGGTDCIPFGEAKIKTACLYALKVPQQMVEFYHQRLDNYDKLNLDALQNGIKIAVEYLKQFNESKK
jgi:Zn-dependent M28 family amino/carboxypeptidase